MNRCWIHIPRTIRHVPLLLHSRPQAAAVPESGICVAKSTLPMLHIHGMYKATLHPRSIGFSWRLRGIIRREQVIRVLLRQNCLSTGMTIVRRYAFVQNGRH